MHIVYILSLRGYPETWLGKRVDFLDSERIFHQQRSARTWHSKVIDESSIPQI